VTFAWVVVAASLVAGCVSTTMQVPPGHPARTDVPGAPQAEPAAILRPGAPLYTPGAGEPEPAEHHHHHGAPPADAGGDAEEGQQHRHHDHGHDARSKSPKKPVGEEAPHNHDQGAP
jgi:hypothetical protein